MTNILGYAIVNWYQVPYGCAPLVKAKSKNIENIKKMLNHDFDNIVMCFECDGKYYYSRHNLNEPIKEFNDAYENGTWNLDVELV